VLLFLAGVLMATGMPLPRPGLSFWPWIIDGAVAQVAATALMLAAMGERSFVVTIAYIKTEPIQVALFGLIFLGDIVTWPMMTAIIVATAGVVIMSTKPGGMVGGMRPTLTGLASGGMFALSAIGFRGAILNLDLPNYPMAATPPRRQLTGGAKRRLEAITPAGYQARIDLTMTDEGPTAQALVIISATAIPGH
jgi:drug/metabolite transporter (DMT)-like permease